MTVRPSRDAGDRPLHLPPLVGRNPWGCSLRSQLRNHLSPLDTAEAGVFGGRGRVLSDWPGL